MEAVTEFLAMGGHAPFIWPSYILAAVILVTLLGLSLRDLRRNESTLKALRADRRGAFGDEGET